jgi:hypothetical protein
MENFFKFGSWFFVAVMFMCICAYVLVSCNQTKETPKKDNVIEIVVDDTPLKISVIEYDGCEYIIYYEGTKAFMTHKGNCKYCAERERISNEEINHKLDSILTIYEKCNTAE